MEQFKNLIIASFNDAFSISNLCIFHCGPEKVGEDISEDQAAILAEKAILGELKKEDITILTKNEKFLPSDFWAYEHMVTNYYTLVCFIGGENCLTARAWKKVIDHAKRHQALYQKYEREHEYFYVSVCDDLHRCTQTCIHSGASGKAEEIKTHHLNFNGIFDDIARSEKMLVISFQSP